MAHPAESIPIEEEEEYVLMDLGPDFSLVNFPPNTPYTLSGLDTLNPILTIGDGLKMVSSQTTISICQRGEYEETLGSCLVFSETAEEYALVHEESGPSEANLFAGKYIVDSKQTPRKHIKNVCQLHKVLKFKIVCDDTAAKVKVNDNANQRQ